MRIREDSLDILKASSFEGVSHTIDRLVSSFPGDHWLPSSHRYRDYGRRRGHNRLKQDLKDGMVHSNEMAEYIAVAAPVHSVDGWSLLGRSIHCLLRGDPYSAVHLAYYAELRAALAILATQGIGIFDRLHCVIDKKGDCKIVKPIDESGNTIGSHQWTWLVFQWWSQENRSVEILREVIRPNGVSLGTWIDGMDKARSALPPIGAKWLELWGVDIGKYFADRDARNDSSYWPTSVNGWMPRTALDNSKTVIDIWEHLEPTQEAPFSSIDRHLLRIVLLDGYFSATGHQRTSQAGRLGLTDEVDGLVENMGLNDLAKSQWRHFLTDVDTAEPEIIRTANCKSKVGTDSHVGEVMSRATMLLRLATGASAGLLSNAGIGREHLEFWIQGIGSGRGLWKFQEPPEALVDLWIDVEHELEQFGDLDERADVGAPETLDIWNSHAKSIAVLGECERVALWGLGL